MLKKIVFSRYTLKLLSILTNKNNSFERPYPFGFLLVCILYSKNYNKLGKLAPYQVLFL